MPRWPFIVFGLSLAALPAGADLKVSSHGLRLPAGFSVTEFAGDDLAHDCYTLTVNPKGQIVVAGRGYIRTLIDDDGDGKADSAIEVADNPKDGAMGLLWEGDTLWCVGDGGLRRFKIGADGKAVGPSELVRKLKTGSEHDAHALLRGPDGWLYLLCGNTTGISRKDAQRPTSPVREPIAGGVLRFPPDMSYSEIVTDGFRNPYGFDFNGDGELFTFDSDNERCIGLPWYEGCRLYHIVPGGNYGWLAPQRAETWRLPPYFPDVVAPLADLGRGSPTGVACYRHRQFPERFRAGLFLGDWTFGRIYFASLKPNGSTYGAKVETFLESVGDNGFAPTGLVVHPMTGDLFISIGGRGTRGAVYRIRFEAGVNDAAGYVTLPLPKRVHPKSPVPATESDDPSRKAIRLLRSWQLAAGDIGARAAKGTVFEGYTCRLAGPLPAQFSNDGAGLFPFEAKRFGLQAAAGEQRILEREASRLLAMIESGDSSAFAAVAARLTPSSDPIDDIHYLIVLARMAAPRTPAITKTVADALVGLDAKFTVRRLGRDTHWPLRVADLHAELARRDPALNERIVLNRDFPLPGNVIFTRCPGFDRKLAARRFLEYANHVREFAWNAEVVALLGELPDETTRPLLNELWDKGGFAEAILPLLARSPKPTDRDKFLDGLRSPQLAQITLCVGSLEKLAVTAEPIEIVALVRVLRALGDTKSEIPVRDRVVIRLQKLTNQTIGPDRAAWTAWLTKSHPELAARLGGADGVDVADWQLRFGKIDWKVGDVARGQRVYTKASCAACHSTGQALGPDLRGIGGRFGREDLLTAIIQPSKDVSPRYKTVQIATTNGVTHQGLIVYEAPDGVILQTGAATTIRIAGNQIASRGYSDVSLMPVGLLDKLSDGEIADLLAYLRTLK